MAQEQRQRAQKTTPEERAAKQVEMMQESLGLTPEQVEKLKAVQLQFAKEREQARIAAQKTQQDMKAKMETYNAQLKSILTAEQYQKYQQERMNMRKGSSVNKQGTNKDSKDCTQQSKGSKGNNNQQGKGKGKRKS